VIPLTEPTKYLTCTAFGRSSKDNDAMSRNHGC
jgi:hypothetical protein